jgi:hypothetical protein
MPLRCAGDAARSMLQVIHCRETACRRQASADAFHVGWRGSHIRIFRRRSLTALAASLCKGCPHANGLLCFREIAAEQLQHIAGALASYLLAKGDVERAQTIAAERLEAARIIGLRHEVVANLERLGLIAAVAGDLAVAARVLGHSQRQCFEERQHPVFARKPPTWKRTPICAAL